MEQRTSEARASARKISGKTSTNGGPPAKPDNGKIVRGKVAATAGRAVAKPSRAPNEKLRARTAVVEDVRGRSTGESLDRRQLLTALVALKKGDFSVRLPMDWEGL